MFTRASEPQAVGGVLDNGFKLFTASIKQVVPITYIGAVIGAVAGWFVQKSMFDQIAAGGVPEFNVPLMIGSYLAMLVFGSIIMAAAIISIRSTFMSEAMGFGQALTAGVKRFPAVLGATLIYILAFFGGSLLLVIPGIYLSVMLAFAFYAASADNKGPMESIKYSYGLVKGSWWRTAGLLTVMMIIAFVFYMAVGFVVGIFAAASDPAAPLQQNFLLDVVIVPIVTGVVTAMIYCLAYVVYHDLQLRSEGSDLAQRIESLDTA